MNVHLSRSFERIKKKLLSIATLVEESVDRAMESFLECNVELAGKVIDLDQKIDMEEVEVEEECLKMLALHQPVAIDLRYIIAILKINNDLERIGDLATNIAQRAKSLAELPEQETHHHLEDMRRKTQQMLRRSLDSLIQLDPKIAHEVIKADSEVDDLNREMYRLAHKAILKTPHDIRRMFFYVSVSRNLERIADLATNIAEDVLYMIEGRIVRHRIDMVD